MNNQNTPIFKALSALLILKRYHEHTLMPLEKQTGLTRIELDILNFLMEKPDFNTATAIIESNHYSKSHVSTALKHLETNGYIRRFFDHQNKKTTYISMTDQAFKIAAEAARLKKQSWQNLLEGISEEDLVSMLSVLDQIVENARDSEKKHQSGFILYS